MCFCKIWTNAIYTPLWLSIYTTLELCIYEGLGPSNIHSSSKLVLVRHNPRLTLILTPTLMWRFFADCTKYAYVEYELTLFTWCWRSYICSAEVANQGIPRIQRRRFANTKQNNSSVTWTSPPYWFDHVNTTLSRVELSDVLTAVWPEYILYWLLFEKVVRTRCVCSVQYWYEMAPPQEMRRISTTAIGEKRLKKAGSIRQTGRVVSSKVPYRLPVGKTCLYYRYEKLPRLPGWWFCWASVAHHFLSFSVFLCFFFVDLSVNSTPGGGHTAHLFSLSSAFTLYCSHFIFLYIYYTSYIYSYLFIYFSFSRICIANRLAYACRLWQCIFRST